MSIKINGQVQNQQTVLQNLQRRLQECSLNTEEYYYEDYLEPITSLQQLYYFDCNKDPANVSKVPLKKYIRNLVIVCHDMMGGYKQDNFQRGYKHSVHNYRYYEWALCDIFIYFSHHRLSIPPSSYIDIAHSKGVKCLGTLITEWEEGEKENELLLKGQYRSKETNQLIDTQNKYIYADKLIELCKHYKFDGYLINIEAKVSNPNELAEWTRYLRDKIHTVVPGSLIIFYDSIISTGELKWQSQLNANNKLNFLFVFKMFFESSDLFFTDYHWNVGQLQQSMQNAGNRKLDIFTGIDIFGRGTYGGGKFNTAQALNEILRSGSSVAFFAPGWTYECEGGMDSKNCFLNRELEFWHGEQSNKFFDPSKDKWNYNQINQVPSQPWEHFKEGNVNIAVTSFFPSFRSFTYQVPQGLSLSGKQIYFRFQVKGTPPNLNDLYAACIEAYDHNRLVFAIDTKTRTIMQPQMPFPVRFNAQVYSQTPSEWEEIQLELDIPNIGYQITHLMFYQVGQDVEYWAGYYGARFKGEDMGFKGYDQSKDMCKYLHTRRCCELPIHTFYNDGVGKQYFIEGEPSCLDQGCENLFHNNINEFDFDFAYFSKKICANHSINYTLQIDETQSWNGLSSLKIQGQVNVNQPILIKLMKTSIRNFTQDLFVDLQIRKTSTTLDFDVYFAIQNKSLVQLKRMLQKSRGNSWYSYHYNLDKQNVQINEVKGVYLLARSSQVEKFQINIGGFSLYDEEIKNNYKQIMKFSEQIIGDCKVRENIQNIISPNDKHLHVDLLIKLNFDDSVHQKVKVTRLFLNNKWVETTKRKDLLLENQKISAFSQEIEIKAQLILDNGYRVPLEMIKPFIINIQEQLIELF